jgi:hypothetical protein
MNFAPLYGAIAATAAIRRASEERRKYEEGFASCWDQAIERFEQLEDEAGQSVDELRTKQQDIEARLNEVFPPIKTDNQQHPVAPPPELVQKWALEKGYDQRDWLYELHIANHAAQWGADQELEACCEWLPSDLTIDGQDLRSVRRPKPPSLKEQAMRVLVENGTNLDGRMELDSTDIETIRRALEALPE